jgi:Fic-DOC domain mobile mystery protein B
LLLSSASPTYPFGATPLDKNELDGLIPDYFSTQEELNESETRSIQSAVTWAKRSKKLKSELLTVPGVLLLHNRMFSGIWKWAGSFRVTEKNLGCLSQHIQTEVLQLCSNVSYRIENKFYTSWQELAVECHYNLVRIHPFPNGNGRHARLVADLLLHFNQQKSLT